MRQRERDRVTELPSSTAYPVAVAAAPSGALWVVGNGQDKGLPLVERWRGQAWEFIERIPPFAPAGIAALSDDEAWIAGAATYESLAVRMQRRKPSESEDIQDPVAGILDHLRATRLVRYTVRDGPLLAVTVDSDGSVVAVGAKGVIVELRSSPLGESVRVSRVTGKPWLFAAVTDGDSVWVLGEQGTLLRRRSGQWIQVPIPGLAKHALTSLLRHEDRWLVGGPETLFELREL